MNKNFKKLIINSLWNSSSFIFISVITYLTTPILVWKLGLEGYGIYIIITSLFGYYAIFDLGLGQGLVKFVSEYYSRKQLENINIAINTSILIQMFVGILASTFLIILSPVIVDLLNISERYKSESIYYIYLCSIGFFFLLLVVH